MRRKRGTPVAKGMWRESNGCVAPLHDRDGISAGIPAKTHGLPSTCPGCLPGPGVAAVPRAQPRRARLATIPQLARAMDPTRRPSERVLADVLRDQPPPCMTCFGADTKTARFIDRYFIQGGARAHEDAACGREKEHNTVQDGTIPQETRRGDQFTY